MRIYLSSTYVDLVEHRAAVARVLRQMGHEVIGMEEYVAEGARPIDRCLADVLPAISTSVSLRGDMAMCRWRPLLGARLLIRIWRLNQ